MYHRSKDKILSRIGYYNDQKGIMNRYLRELNNWNPHLEKTKKVILEGMTGKDRNKVIVLGSGWLLDVPLEELSREFKEVWLADVYHPPLVIKRASKYPNIRFIQTELTGMAEQVYHTVKVFRKTKFKTPVEDLKPDSVIDLLPFDYVVSCNILSQLDIILTEFLADYPIYTVPETEFLIKQIQNEHVDNLPRGKTTLICDQEEWTLDSNENIQTRRPLLHVPLPEGTFQNWIWKFDTHMMYYPSLMTYFKVTSLNF